MILNADSADGVLVTAPRIVDGVSVWCKQALVSMHRRLQQLLWLDCLTICTPPLICTFLDF